MILNRTFCFTAVFFIFFSPAFLFAQDSPAKKVTDTSIPVNKNAVNNLPQQNAEKPAREIRRSRPTDSLRQKISASVISDSFALRQRVADSSLNLARTDSAIAKPKSFNSENFIITKLLSNNRFINVKDPPVYFIEENRNATGKEFLFYSLCLIVLLLGIFKTIYSGYFKNLFRVYFNTSLRQTQLADQLLQAKLPSFILNIFFTVTAGIYIWLLFSRENPPQFINSKLLLPFCILAVAALYFIKFCILKFIGWISDIQRTTDSYIFAIFLVNKIMGILLVPIIILLAFFDESWLPAITNISFMVIALFFLSRYIKSYGAIEKKIPISRFHFLVYIIGAEVLPIVLIYKVVVDYLI
jgi:hypothetical protein